MEVRPCFVKVIHRGSCSRTRGTSKIRNTPDCIIHSTQTLPEPHSLITFISSMFLASTGPEVVIVVVMVMVMEMEVVMVITVALVDLVTLAPTLISLAITSIW
ncbi:hypothetical protein PVAG01_04593 [Phlyctema vagabunda]|uniref:NADH dehydrogenase subunit 4L n=1 Tax=Phlyctema vagabunda TaxID=108571 RepID=A0ABR4PHP0_9HELO